MGNKQKMIDFAVAIANDNSHGYDQNNRWGPDYDCSSLMYASARAGGYNVPTSGTRYTGTMKSHFEAAGFKAVPFDGNLNDLTPGDIMLNVRDHTEMYIGGGKFVGASINEYGGVTGGKPGDQTGREIRITPSYIYSTGWNYVLVPPPDTAAVPVSPGKDVTLWTWHGGKNQQWIFEPLNNAAYAIKNVASGLYLDVRGSVDEDGARLCCWPWHGGDNQQWIYSAQAAGLAYSAWIISVLPESRRLDVRGSGKVNDTEIIIFHAMTGLNQRFILVPVPGTEAYYIMPAHAPGMCLDCHL
ncbi:MAG: RICIN domain-containing protein [Coriobacteriales bacterium]|jgi:hypothetical protein|nr:RICIN domain-containing protein [Coriobacteriales bacterium]